jgi:hypothetical protein
MVMDQLPDLDSLRPHLGILPINTGLQRPLTTPSGIITDDTEGLHAVTNEDGCVMLQSGIEFSILSKCWPMRGRTGQFSGDIRRNLCLNSALLQP